jgi:hypothetical protein
MSGSLILLVTLGALDVRWGAPPSCPVPDLKEFTEGSDGAAVVRIEAGERAAWLVDLTFLRPFQGTRRLELQSCGDANRAARALLVLGLRGPDEFLGGEVSTAPEEPPSPPPIVSASAVPEPEVQALAGFVHVGALAHLVTLPAATGRARVGGGVRFKWLQAELGLRTGTTAAFSGLTAAPTQAEVVVWPMLGVDLSACWAPVLGRFRAHACASGVVEGWQLEGRGVSTPASGVGVLAGVGALLGATFRLVAGLEVGVSAAARGHVIRPGAAFSGVPALTAGPLGLELGAWVGWGS